MKSSAPSQDFFILEPGYAGLTLLPMYLAEVLTASGHRYLAGVFLSSLPSGPADKALCGASSPNTRYRRLSLIDYTTRTM